MNRPHRIPSEREADKNSRPVRPWCGVGCWLLSIANLYARNGDLDSRNNGDGRNDYYDDPRHDQHHHDDRRPDYGHQPCHRDR